MNQVTITPEKHLVKEWELLLEDMHGEDKAQNQEIFSLILQKEEISQDAKNWIRKYMEAHGYKK